MNILAAADHDHELTSLRSCLSPFSSPSAPLLRIRIRIDDIGAQSQELRTPVPRDRSRRHASDMRMRCWWEGSSELSMLAQPLCWYCQLKTRLFYLYRLHCLERFPRAAVPE